MRVFSVLGALALLLAAPLSLIASGEVHRIRVDGVINPVSAKFIADAVKRGERESAEAVVIELDTPGGLLEATRDIVQCFLGANVPVIVYVSPDGARAGSAGVFITLAAHIAAMAPGANIGAAHPVSIGGGGIPGQGTDSAGAKVMSDKVTNDAAALARSIAETRGRNVDWAEKAVRSSDAITSRDALEQGVIDYIAPSLDSLLLAVQGRKIALKDLQRTLETSGASIITYEMSWREKLFDKLSDPNIAYIFMMIGIYGILFELYNPGAVLPGVLGGLGLLLAFFAFQTLPVNAVGVLLILFGIALLLLEIKITSYGLLSVAGAISLFLGSIMLFDVTIPALRVSLSVVIPVVLFSVFFFLFAVGMGVKAQKRKVETGREGLIGMEGEALEAFTAESGSAIWTGMILANGEYWKAISDEPVASGAKLKIIALEGMVMKCRSAIAG